MCTAVLWSAMIRNMSLNCMCRQLGPQVWTDQRYGLPLPTPIPPLPHSSLAGSICSSLPHSFPSPFLLLRNLSRFLVKGLAPIHHPTPGNFSPHAAYCGCPPLLFAGAFPDTILPTLLLSICLFPPCCDVPISWSLPCRATPCVLPCHAIHCPQPCHAIYCPLLSCAIHCPETCCAGHCPLPCGAIHCLLSCGAMHCLLSCCVPYNAHCHDVPYTAGCHALVHDVHCHAVPYTACYHGVPHTAHCHALPYNSATMLSHTLSTTMACQTLPTTICCATQPLLSCCAIHCLVPCHAVYSITMLSLTLPTTMLCHKHIAHCKAVPYTACYHGVPCLHSCPVARHLAVVWGCNEGRLRVYASRLTRKLGGGFSAAYKWLPPCQPSWRGSPACHDGVGQAAPGVRLPGFLEVLGSTRPFEGFFFVSPSPAPFPACREV